MKGQEDDHAGKLFENRLAALEEMLVGNRLQVDA